MCNNCIKDSAPEDAIMFNSMGMPVFDVVLGSYYAQQARKDRMGRNVE